MRRSTPTVVALLALLASAPGRAQPADKPPEAGAAKPSDKDAARAEYKRATAAFGLGQFAEAAGAYERAFRLVPDPAFLFNAAQAYRLAGLKPRALELYRNYLRVFGGEAAASEARRHVETLEKDLAAGEAAAPAPPIAAPAPAAAAPVPAPAPPGPVTVVPPPVSSPPLSLVPEPPAGSLAGAPAAEPSVFRRPWFWAVAGGVALAVATTVIVIATRGDAAAPRPTWRRVEIGVGP